MLDLQEIENTIQELEDSDTTFDTCIKLSALYNVRDHLTKHSDEVTLELSDIFPAYQKYVDAKYKFQMNEISDSQMIKFMELLCQEIKDFISSLYSGTDTDTERHYIEKTCFFLYNAFTN